MNEFTLTELGIIHACLTDLIIASKIFGGGGAIILEDIADKCIKLRVEAGCISAPIHFNELKEHKS